MAKKDFKKELSKELMYKKIMPSSSKPEPAEKPSVGYDDAVTPLAAGYTAAQSRSVPAFDVETVLGLHATATFCVVLLLIAASIIVGIE
jgi:hypothetical protein